MAEENAYSTVSELPHQDTVTQNLSVENDNISIKSNFKKQYPVDISQIRSWWEVPAICHFCSLFRTAFSLPDFEIEDLEESLVGDIPGTENLFLSYLVVDLLQGCYQRKDIKLAKLNYFLRDILQARWINENENKFNPYEYEGESFMDFSVRTKVDIIHSICDYRLDVYDTWDAVKDSDPDILRVEPLGKDHNGDKYYYFYGSRLYKETAPTPREFPEPKDSKHKKKKNREKIQPNLDVLPEKFDTYGNWSLVSSTVEEWEKLAESFAHSKYTCERNLFKIIINDFIPELPGIIEARERAVQKRISEEFAQGNFSKEPRTSTRLQIKRKEKEELESLLNEVKREELRNSAAAEERARREQAEKDRKARMEARAALKAERDRRAALREEKARLIAEGKPLPAYLLTKDDSPVPSPSSTSGRSSRKKNAVTLSEEDLYTALFKVFDAIHQHKDSWPFHEPVTDELAPNYSSVIKNPICLADIEQKLDSSEYSDRKEFVDDFVLMFDNCITFNGKFSDYGKIARDLKDMFFSCLREHLPKADATSDEDSSSRLGRGRRKRKLIRFNDGYLSSSSSYSSDSDDGFIHRKYTTSKSRNYVKSKSGRAPLTVDELISNKRTRHEDILIRPKTVPHVYPGGSKYNCNAIRDKLINSRDSSELTESRLPSLLHKQQFSAYQPMHSHDYLAAPKHPGESTNKIIFTPISSASNNAKNPIIISGVSNETHIQTQPQGLQSNCTPTVTNANKTVQLVLQVKPVQSQVENSSNNISVALQPSQYQVIEPSQYIKISGNQIIRPAVSKPQILTAVTQASSSQCIPLKSLNSSSNISKLNLQNMQAVTPQSKLNGIQAISGRLINTPNKYVTLVADNSNRIVSNSNGSKKIITFIPANSASVTTVPIAQRQNTSNNSNVHIPATLLPSLDATSTPSRQVNRPAILSNKTSTPKFSNNSAVTFSDGRSNVVDRIESSNKSSDVPTMSLSETFFAEENIL